MWKKLASIAAMVSAAVTVSACQTSMYKPIICEPGTALKGGRCQKVPPFQKTELKPIPAKPKYRPKTVTTDGDQGSLNQGIKQPPKQDVYGRPIAK